MCSFRKVTNSEPGRNVYPEVRMAVLTEADMVQILREQGVEVGKSSYLYIRTFVHTDAHKCTHMPEHTPNKQQPS